jgi:hypothetical protein
MININFITIVKQPAPFSPPIIILSPLKERIICHRYHPLGTRHLRLL